MSEHRLKELYQLAARYRATDAGECDIPPETMIDVLEGRMAGAARERTMLAIMSSPACRREFELLRALVEQSSPAARTTPGPALRPMRVAASIAILITAGLLWLVLPVRESDTLRDVGTAPVRIIAPARNATVDTEARFTWHAVPRALRYEFNLVGNGGRVVFTAVQPDTSLVLPDSITVLPAERLQWWVESMTADGVRVRSTLRDVRLNTP